MTNEQLPSAEEHHCLIVFRDDRPRLISPVQTYRVADRLFVVDHVLADPQRALASFAGSEDDLVLSGNTLTPLSYTRRVAKAEEGPVNLWVVDQPRRWAEIDALSLLYAAAGRMVSSSVASAAPDLSAQRPVLILAGLGLLAGFVVGVLLGRGPFAPPVPAPAQITVAAPIVESSPPAQPSIAPTGHARNTANNRVPSEPPADEPDEPAAVILESVAANILDSTAPLKASPELVRAAKAWASHLRLHETEKHTLLVWRNLGKEACANEHKKLAAWVERLARSLPLQHDAARAASLGATTELCRPPAGVPEKSLKKGALVLTLRRGLEAGCGCAVAPPSEPRHRHGVQRTD